MIDAFNYSVHKKAKVDYTHCNFIFSLQFANGSIDYFAVDANAPVSEQKKTLTTESRFDAVKTFVSRHPEKNYMGELMKTINNIN